MARTATKEKPGVSLAKGPVGLLGLLGLIYGISALIFGGHGFATQHVPHGAVHGKLWLGLEVNGWSDLLFIAAGLLLLVGATAHLGAKGMSLLVGLVLGTAAVIALIRGNGVFGLLAANHLTELVWGAGGVLLILLSLLPRVGGTGKREGLYEPAERPLAPRRVQRQPHTTTVESPPRAVTRTQTPVEDVRDVRDGEGSSPAGAYRTDNHDSR